MNQVKLRAGGGPWCCSFIVSTCYTTAGGKACQRLTQERFVMVLTDCDSLFFTAVHWGKGVGFSCQEEQWLNDSTPENGLDCSSEAGLKKTCW